jgi:excisionase family DNA binding protein
MTPSREIMPSSDAARFLGISKGTCLKWAERGFVPALRVDGRWWFRRRELEAWLAGRTANSDSRVDAP